EPGCHLGTVAEAIAFFDEHLLHGPDEELVRRHLGICLDACHLAVEFERPAAAVRALRSAGIRIAKLQLSTGLRIQFDDRDRDRLLAALAPFAEDTYLHQVVERRAERLRHWLDLPDALAAFAGGDCEWRVHFHVP